MAKRVIIMGAAGRDFHNFNQLFRGKKDYDVVCFTAAQIPNISGRKYPSELAGKGYPKGIPIYPESELSDLIKKHRVDEAVFSYSDVSNEDVMHHASIANAAGADFRLAATPMLESSVPVISVCAVRTGAGKSQTTRRIAAILRDKGYRVVVIRHPMPYGDLAKQAVQRFATFADMDKAGCTIEEREEYEPHIANGITVYAGVDYERILRQAEGEADVIIWDGGNNDLPFIKPTLHIVVADPLRPGHELAYYPGETNVRLADAVIINKEDSAKKPAIAAVEKNVYSINPTAVIIHAASPIWVDGSIAGKRVIVVEDGPTVTHGGMAIGAGFVAAKAAGSKIIDPRPFAVGSIADAFAAFPHLERVVPALGYYGKQLKDLEATINASSADVVVTGTPIDLRHLIKVNKPIVRVRYSLEERGPKRLAALVLKAAKKRPAA